jgi:hypothetical protein
MLVKTSSIACDESKWEEKKPDFRREAKYDK